MPQVDPWTLVVRLISLIEKMAVHSNDDKEVAATVCQSCGLWSWSPTRWRCDSAWCCPAAPCGSNAAGREILALLRPEGGGDHAADARCWGEQAQRLHSKGEQTPEAGPAAAWNHEWKVQKGRKAKHASQEGGPATPESAPQTVLTQKSPKWADGLRAQAAASERYRRLGLMAECLNRHSQVGLRFGWDALRNLSGEEELAVVEEEVVGAAVSAFEHATKEEKAQARRDRRKGRRAAAKVKKAEEEALLAKAMQQAIAEEGLAAEDQHHASKPTVAGGCTDEAIATVPARRVLQAVSDCESREQHPPFSLSRQGAEGDAEPVAHLGAESQETHPLNSPPYRRGAEGEGADLSFDDKVNAILTRVEHECEHGAVDVGWLRRQLKVQVLFALPDPHLETMIENM